MPRHPPQPTLLEDLVRRPAPPMTASLRIALEQVLADFAKEARADEDFRRELRALVQHLAREMMAARRPAR
jgi:hypothetical protein